MLDTHRIDLSQLYGGFKPYKSFEEIIKKEYNSWINTDTSSKAKLESMMKKNKELSLDDWIKAFESHGIHPD